MVLVAAGSAPAGAQELRGQPPASCPTPPTYDPGVSTPQSVLGFPLGIGQAEPVTSEQIFRYVQAVDQASDRVTSFDAGSSWGGRPLKVAIVSSRERMRPAELRRIRERFVALREGRGGRHDDLRDSPAIVWAGNVHGGEKSGADATAAPIAFSGAPAVAGAMPRRRAAWAAAMSRRGRGPTSPTGTVMHASA